MKAKACEVKSTAATLFSKHNISMICTNSTQEDKPTATENVTTCFLVVLCMRDMFKCHFEALDTFVLVDICYTLFVMLVTRYFII